VRGAGAGTCPGGGGGDAGRGDTGGGGQRHAGEASVGHRRWPAAPEAVNLFTACRALDTRGESRHAFRGGAALAAQRWKSGSLQPVLVFGLDEVRRLSPILQDLRKTITPGDRRTTC